MQACFPSWIIMCAVTWIALLFISKSEIQNNRHCNHERIILMNLCFGVICCFAGPAFLLRLAIYSNCKKEEVTWTANTVLKEKKKNQQKKLFTCCVLSLKSYFSALWALSVLQNTLRLGAVGSCWSKKCSELHAVTTEIQLSQACRHTLPKAIYKLCLSADLF